MKQNKKLIFLIGSLVVIILSISSYILYTSQSNGFNPSKMTKVGKIDIRTDILIELTEDAGQPVLTMTNQGHETFGHGSPSTASLQTFLDENWYFVNITTERTITAVYYFLYPGCTYSAPFFWDDYGDLPDGIYPLVFKLGTLGSEISYADIIYAAVEFSVQDGKIIYP